MLILTAMPVCSVNVSVMSWSTPIGTASEAFDPSEIEPDATALSAADGAALAPALAAVLAAGALEVPALLHAAMIAGTLTRPAVPAIPLRTVRLETALTGMGSAMAYSSSMRCPTKSDRTNQIVGMHPTNVKRTQEFGRHEC